MGGKGGNKRGEREALSGETVHTFPVSRWKIYLVLVPTVIAAAFLTILFFSAFLALFLIAGAVLGLWIWWSRRKVRKSNRGQSLEGEYVVIKEPHIVETETDKAGDK
jgi:Flp pilus assembly protein TadB